MQGLYNLKLLLRKKYDFSTYMYISKLYVSRIMFIILMPPAVGIIHVTV